MNDPLLFTILAINAFAFLLFGFDKWRAKNGRRRVPEAHLLLVAALSGCIGAWTGMSVFRHKTRKLSFQIKVALASAVNALWIWIIWFR